MDTSWKDFLNSKNNYEAFSRIYNRYVNDLLSYGTSLGFAEETCRDAAHDVFFKIFTEKDRLLSVKNPTSYLFRSFRNLLFNIQKRQSRLTSDFTNSEHSFATEITILDSIITQEEAEKLKKTVEDLLNQLTPRQREAIYLKYMQGMDYEEIAQLLDMNVNSARRLVHRGIENLRESTSGADNKLVSLAVFLLLTGIGNQLMKLIK